MATYNIDDSGSGSGASFTNSQNVVANNDTITWTVGGFVGGTSLSKSDSNCTATLSWSTVPSSGGNSGNAQITINNFTRSTSNGSYSATITGTGKDASNNQITRTATISGTIGASTGTISIGGGSSIAAGTTVTVSWTSNDSSAKGWNSTTGRFSPGSGSSTLTGTSGSFNVTCQDPAGNVPDGVWETNAATLRLSSSSSSVIATSNNVLIHTQADAGTAGLSLTTDTQSNGTFIITASTTATSPGTVNYRFIDGPNTSGTVLQTFSTSNTYSGVGSQRGSPITAQVREQIQTNNTGTVYSEDFSSATITVPYVNPQTNVTLPANRNILWDASSFSLTIGNGNILDEYKVVLTSNTSIILEDWTTKNTASGSDFTFTVSNNINTTYFPNQDLADPGVSCTVYVRRSTTNGGNGSATSVGTFTVKRKYRGGPFASISGPSAATIGAQEYFYYNGTSRAVTIGGAGIVNGFTYIARIDSGTTYGGATSGIVINSVASGGSASGILTQNQLPPVNASVTYRVYCIVPTSLGGDGTTEWACSPLQIYSPLNSAQTRFTVTRSDYVAADTTTSQMTITGTGVVSNGFQNFLIANNNTTTNPVLGVATTETSQEYRINNGFAPGNASEVIYFTYGTGNSSLSETITNSDIVAGTGINYFLYTRVREVDDGNGIWSAVTSDGTTLVRALINREAALVAPTITTTSTSINSVDYSKVVPWIRIGDTGAAQDAGNLQLAFSTSTSTPTNWYNVDTGGLNKNGWYFSINTSYSRASQTVYIGVRRQSAVTSTTTTPAYSNVSITSTTNLITPGGSNADGYLNQNNGFFNAGYISSNNEIRIFAADSLNETVTFESLANPTGNIVDVDDSSATSTFFFSTAEFQSQYGIDITSGTTSGNLTVGDTVDSYLMPTGNTGSGVNRTFTLANPGDLPSLGNTVNYKFWRRQLVANGGDGTKQYPSQAALVAEFFARRFDQADETITVTGVRQTLANNHSTNLVLTIADGNSSTDYQLYSQGSVYDTRVGNGTLTATNPGELPTAGNTRNYNIRYRQSGTSDNYQNATGTGTSFTVGRLDPMNLGALSNPVPVNSTVNSATITLGGAVGNITALLTKNSGLGTVRLSKNNQSYANSTASGTSITVVDGNTLSVRAESPSTFSNTTTCTLTLTQDSVTIFSDTFSFTTEASTSGGSGGGGGTGDYGLELRDSSNKVILTNSDLTGDFCYDEDIVIAQGSYTAVGPTSAAPKGGNTVLILTDLNPFNASGRVQAELINSGKQVRLTIADNETLSAAQTYKVVVFHFPQ